MLLGYGGEAEGRARRKSCNELLRLVAQCFVLLQCTGRDEAQDNALLSSRRIRDFAAQSHEGNRRQRNELLKLIALCLFAVLHAGA